MDTSSILVQRLGALEDLLRKSEGSISHMLSRLKDVELAVTTIGKTQEKSVPEVRYLFDELNNVKRQVTTIDQTWRQTYTDFSGSLQNEIRGRIPQQLDSIAQQLRQENANMKTEVNETHQLMRRATDQWNHELHDIRQIVQTNSWKTEQLQTTVGQQHQQMLSLERRVDQDAHDLRTFAAEVERNAGSFRQFVETAVRSAHADLVQRVDVEQRSRDGLQQDVQNTITRLRDDVQRGLAHASATAKILEENVSSLESVLRAEVRSRIAKTEEIQIRFEQLTAEMERDASSAAQVLQGLDDEGGAMHHTLHSTQTKFDKLWDEVRKLKKAQPPQQQRTTAGTAAVGGGGVGDAALATLEFEEDAESEAGDEPGDISPEGIVERMSRMSASIRKKASLQQLAQLKSAMYQSMCRHVEQQFLDMVDRMEKDQTTIEDSLAALRVELKSIQGMVPPNQTTGESGGGSPARVSHARTSSARTVSSTRSSAGGGTRGDPIADDDTPRSSTSRRSSVTSNAGQPVRRSRPPSENPNVMHHV